MSSLERKFKVKKTKANSSKKKWQKLFNLEDVKSQNVNKTILLESYSRQDFLNF